MATEKIILSNEVIECMSVFSRITNSDIRDCILGNSRIIFIVGENQAGKAIGTKGANVRKLEAALNKKVKIIEYNPDIRQFIMNIAYPNRISDIVEEQGTYTIVPADTMSRSMLIGRSAVNLRENESIIKRYFDIKELRVK